MVDAEGQGEGGMNWKSSTDTYILPYVRYTASGKLLFSKGSSAGYSVMNSRGGMGWGGREAPEAGHICRHIADACCCAAETNNIVQQVCSNKKNNKDNHVQNSFRSSESTSGHQQLTLTSCELLCSVSSPLSFSNGLKIAVKNRADMFEAQGAAAFKPFRL